MIRQIAFISFLSFSLTFGAHPSWADDDDDDDDEQSYLALGDSLAFGYSPLVVPVKIKKYNGYPEIVEEELDGKLANASCFGETSSHFLNLNAVDLGCKAWRAAYPLFVSYQGTQMDYAVQYLKRNRKVKLVTINIGVNDLGVLLQGCGNNPACALGGLPAVLGTYQTNLVTIYSTIRSTGYKGPIVAVTGYALNYSDPLQVPAFTALNSILSGVTTAFGGKVADASLAFEAAAKRYGGDVCKTGLLIERPDNTCDTHPSAKGHALIAKLISKYIADDDDD